MMNKIEEAIIYATIMHQGKVRQLEYTSYILHPLEVAQILSTMTSDQDIITAGILHDIVEDTDGTLGEIEQRFGERVAFLVSSDSAGAYPEEPHDASWKQRKEDSMRVLKESGDLGVKMLWLADKLANIRSLARVYSEQGDRLWEMFQQSDPEMNRWYYKTIAEQLELSLNKTGAFKELIKHINFIWPGTFDSEKARYKKYREVNIEGCRLIGRGAKGEVYRYDDELVIKVYNQHNTYNDVEREINLARKAFILGIPTAISFGIVSVGENYGALYELVESQTLSSCIARNPLQVENYARIMANLARTIHSVEATEGDGFPLVYQRVKRYIEGGIGRWDEELAKRCMALLDALPDANTLIHGDFHTGNVFLQRGEALLIDMDRLAIGHPIVELSDLCYFYVIRPEFEPDEVEEFMGFSVEIARSFFRFILKYYLNTEDEARIDEVTEKASLISYSRMIRYLRKQGASTEREKLIRRCVERIWALTNKLDSLTF